MWGLRDDFLIAMVIGTNWNPRYSLQNFQGSSIPFMPPFSSLKLCMNNRESMENPINPEKIKKNHHKYNSIETFHKRTPFNSPNIPCFVTPYTHPRLDLRTHLQTRDIRTTHVTRPDKIKRVPEPTHPTTAISEKNATLPSGP